jgi:hypothetical protein
MTRNIKWPAAFLTLAITVTGDVSAQDQRQQRTPERVFTVNELGGESDEHLGPVQLIGVIAAVIQGRGFVLVDKCEYANCGLTCLTEPCTKKIPVRWSGQAPLLERTVCVAGVLSRTEKGLSFVGREIRGQ